MPHSFNTQACNILQPCINPEIVRIDVAVVDHQFRNKILVNCSYRRSCNIIRCGGRNLDLEFDVRCGVALCRKRAHWHHAYAERKRQDKRQSLLPCFHLSSPFSVRRNRTRLIIAPIFCLRKSGPPLLPICHRRREASRGHLI